MAKKTAVEADLERLKAQVAKQRGTSEDPDGRLRLRRLRKRLKRAQRRRRRVIVRKRNAAGNKEKEGATA